MMLTFQFGMTMSFTGIINAAVSGNPNEHNQNETIRLTDAESSWLGKFLNCVMFFFFGFAVQRDRKKTNVNLSRANEILKCGNLFRHLDNWGALSSNLCAYYCVQNDCYFCFTNEHTCCEYWSEFRCHYRIFVPHFGHQLNWTKITNSKYLYHGLREAKSIPMERTDCLVLCSYDFGSSRIRYQLIR